MAQAFESLKALTSDIVRIDVPVPACLNHCINQEVFYCKVCGEVFDNIHKYISHGKLHRSTSKICSWCGGTWPTYSALCIHQLVWDGSEDEKGKTNDDGEAGLLNCPLNCGLERESISTIQTHLISFHGANTSQINIKEKDGKTELDVTKEADSTTTTSSCPKCSTSIFKQMSLERHIAFHCLSRSPAVKQRTDLYLSSDVYSDNPLLPLNMEIQALVSHLKELLSNNQYSQAFEESGLKADVRYDKLPEGFTKQYLAWLPTGYTQQVLEAEAGNFAVTFDLWSQVIDKLSGPENLKEVAVKLESDLYGMLKSGMVSRWPPLLFDQAMLDNPDQDILNSLETQLGWVK